MEGRTNSKRRWPEWLQMLSCARANRSRISPIQEPTATLRGHHQQPELITVGTSMSSEEISSAKEIKEKSRDVSNGKAPPLMLQPANQLRSLTPLTSCTEAGNDDYVSKKLSGKLPALKNSISTSVKDELDKSRSPAVTEQNKKGIIETDVSPPQIQLPLRPAVVDDNGEENKDVDGQNSFNKSRSPAAGGTEQNNQGLRENDVSLTPIQPQSRPAGIEENKDIDVNALNKRRSQVGTEQNKKGVMENDVSHPKIQLTSRPANDNIEENKNVDGQRSSDKSSSPAEQDKISMTENDVFSPPIQLPSRTADNIKENKDVDGQGSADESSSPAEENEKSMTENNVLSPPIQLSSRTADDNLEENKDIDGRSPATGTEQNNKGVMETVLPPSIQPPSRPADIDGESPAADTEQNNKGVTETIFPFPNQPPSRPANDENKGVDDQESSCKLPAHTEELLAGMAPAI